MKKFMIVALLLAAAGGVYAQKSELRTMKMKSAILGAEKELAVYLPAGYEDSGKNYPVLYLLHGASDTFQAWPVKGNMKFIADEAIASGMALPMIVVMPDARGEGENNIGKNMGYFNMEGWAYEDYFFNELIPYIDRTFHTKAQKQYRAVAGLSMGGGGTAVYAQRHPDVFSSACALSALIQYNGNNPLLRNTPFVKSVEATDPLRFVREATAEQVKELKSVRWMLDCGDDDSLLDGNIDLFRAMREKKIPVELRVRNGGHNWVYWQVSLPSVLQFISTGFAAD